MGKQVQQDLYHFAKLESDRQTGVAEPKDSSNEWNRQSWWNWATEKLIEHVKGDVYWSQFGSDNFGIIRNNTDLQKSITSRYQTVVQIGSEGAEAQELVDELNGLLAC